MLDQQSDETQAPRYVVGIDLGTTNSALCFVDTDISPWHVEMFRVPQWVDIGQFEQRETLPSFHYELTPQEAAAGKWQLPWQDASDESCVGVYARDAGLRHPGRRIASAKSWMSHGGVDRSADLLPWHGDADVSRMSPVDAAAKYLAHFRAAWDHVHPTNPLNQQDVVITLPASFDEIARELTVQAARRAGLHRVFLIEEPQAAFYSWIDSHANAWHERVAAGQLILVCDIGGGTTDLTLIRVSRAGELGDQVQFHRVAVGQHLILGGDNLDLAVAKLAEAKLLGESGASSLAADQWERLIQASRLAKETMLSQPRPESYTLSLPSRGSQLIGGSQQVTLSAAEIDAALVEGFFPSVALSDRPSVGESGFREFGLPYAADPAVTRHLAAFLSEHRRSGLAADDSVSDDRPEWLLFNGGVMAAPALRKRIGELLSRWFKHDNEIEWQPQVLEAKRLDLAVARGATYYGMVRRGEGVRIAANLGRSYYMQVADKERGDTATSVICLIPGNAQPGERFETSSHPLLLQLGQPVQFPLWASSTRLADRVGEVLQLDQGEASRLPPICTSLSDGKRRETKSIRVTIQSELSEIGTVAMWCVDIDSGKRWQLEFDIRSTLQTDREAHTTSGETAGIIDSDTLQQCEVAVLKVFGEAADMTPNKLVSALQDAAGLKRDAWPPSLLRKIWQFLIDHQTGRRKSPQHEARWLNLLSYCLRPGYGVAVDDWRVSQTWKTVYGKLVFPAAQSRIESLILWRRISGGLTRGQQQQLAAPLVSQLQDRSSRNENAELAEIWRMLASMERISVAEKQTLGEAALANLSRKKMVSLQGPLMWAVGRLGSRSPVYGPLNTVVPTAVIEDWLSQLRSTPSPDTALQLAVLQLARRTGDRFRDISDTARADTELYLRSIAAPEHSIALLEQVGELSYEEQAAVFGDSLPLGIRLL